tara:strand:- start:141987 stop:142817 length:831 start_codon:yes stop_codon:yes gene_type:complete
MDTRLPVRTFLFHCLALVLVVVYVNTFALWRGIGNLFGRGIRDNMPFIVIAVLVLGVGIYIGVKARRGALSIAWPWLAAAVLVAIVGLASTDPAFPAKRIHVPQYVILAIVLHFSVRASERTALTLLFVFFAVTAYGVHDEFLQGLHPRRTYGLRDMFVNMCGAGAGVALVRALLPAGRSLPLDVGTRAVRSGLISAFVLAVGGVFLFAFAGTGFRTDILPYWTVLPALSGALALAFAAERLPLRGDRLAVRALVCVCLLYAVHPLVINVALLDFA